MSYIEPNRSALHGLASVRSSAAEGEQVRKRQRSRFAWARLISPVIVLIIWQLTHVLNLVSTEQLPPPSQVVSAGWTLITTGNAAYGGTLQSSMLTSLERFGIGFACGGGVALALAIVAGLNRIGDAGIDPLMQMVRTLPLFGLVPVFIVWFGIGETPKYLLVALAAAVPLYLNAYAGIRSIDGRLHELSRVLRLNRRELLTQVVLPSALPNILVGLRQSLGAAWLALVVAEQFNANSGLGFIITQGEQFNQNDEIYLCLIVYTLLGLLTDWIVRMLERRALAYRPEVVR
jgi:sulfonate transport system permease protein